MIPPLDPKLFDLSGKALWVMHCAEGPVPLEAIEAARKVLPQESRPWDLSLSEWHQIPNDVRRQAGALLGVAPDDITITSSTSAGLTAIAQSYPWQDGDEVLAPLGEFPANVWPWKALETRGVRFREMALWEGHLSGKRAWDSEPPTSSARPEQRLLEAIGPRTRILTVSWVRFQDGLALDLGVLAEGCTRRGVDLVIDGIQGAGTMPVDLRGAAAFASGVQKGLLAPQGLGLLWTSPEFRARLRPFGSWYSVEDATDFARPNTDFERSWLEDGRKLEIGAPNPLGMKPLAASLGLLARTGTNQIAAHVGALQDLLIDKLRASLLWQPEAARLADLRKAGKVSSILSLHHRGRGQKWLQELVKAGMARQIFASVREGYLRVALHGFHTEADVARLAEWLLSAS